MFRTILLSLLLISCGANIFLYYQINTELKKVESNPEDSAQKKLRSYTVNPEKIYFLGDYCRLSDSLELFSFEKDTFKVWNRVSSSLEKTKATKANSIGKWKVLYHDSAEFSLLYTDEGEELGKFKINLVTVGITGKVISFVTEQNNLLYDLRNCF